MSTDRLTLARQWRLLAASSVCWAFVAATGGVDWPPVAWLAVAGSALSLIAAHLTVRKIGDRS